MNVILAWLTPANRKRVYLTLVALVPVLSLYGWVTHEQAAAWVGVIGAVLGLGTAAGFVPPAVDNASDPATV